MVAIDSGYSSFICTWTKFFLFSFINLINVLIFTKNPSFCGGGILLNIFYSIRQKTSVGAKIHVVLTSCVEKIYFMGEYFKIDYKKKISDFSFFIYSKIKRCVSPFFFAICNLQLLTFLKKNIKEKIRYKILLENLDIECNFLYHVSKLHSIGFVIFLENNSTVATFKVKIHLNHLLFFWKKFSTTQKIYLEIKTSKKKRKISKTISMFRIVGFKKYIYISTSICNSTTVIDLLQNKNHNCIFLISYFPKDLILKKIKSFNSSTANILIIIGNIFFINKILPKIDLREISFVYLIKRNSFRCICSNFHIKKLHLKWYLKKKNFHFKNTKNIICF